MFKLINVDIMRNWANWLIVPGVVMLSGLALYLITHPHNSNGEIDNG